MLLCCDRVMRPIYNGTDYQCDACRLVVEVYSGVLVCGTCGRERCDHIVEVESIATHPEARIPAGLEWHYRGPKFWYGTLGDWYYDLDLYSGKSVRRRVSLSEKARIVSLARTRGAALAAKKHGIPAGTIRSWLSREKVAA